MPPSRRVLSWAEKRVPALARALATPAVRGAVSSRAEGVTRWNEPDTVPRALVLYVTPSPATSRWLAGSLALRVVATVVVPDRPADATALVATLRSESELPLVVVGEGDASAAAIDAARSGASRLALISPPPVGEIAASGWPTTLIQAAATSENRRAVTALDATLRQAGIAVRETEYANVEDGWVRYPRISRGSRRALDDLVAFLDRGIGEASTFDVIPGWDLH